MIIRISDQWSSRSATIEHDRATETLLSWESDPHSIAGYVDAAIQLPRAIEGGQVALVARLADILSVDVDLAPTRLAGVDLTKPAGKPDHLKELAGYELDMSTAGSAHSMVTALRSNDLAALASTFAYHVGA